MLIRKQLPYYFSLLRLNKPIGILLLLWPTLWALWLAQGGAPSYKILFIFIAGTVLMRSAGCAMNDFADRDVDSHVKRTHERPLASGKITAYEALFLAALLAGVAFLLVLQCNSLTIQLAVMGAILALIYPFMKRYTHLPQVGLSVAFTWGIPMAFAAEQNHLGVNAWLLFLTGTLWPMIYDTQYAMVDREDDKKIGIKSTAILFANADKWIIGLLQVLFIVMLMIMGYIFRLHPIYYVALMWVIGLFIYQQWLIQSRHPEQCFSAFLNNNWVGMIIFLGIVGSL
jgi:4-hydroxybenzoate polyprenyltransferase